MQRRTLLKAGALSASGALNAGASFLQKNTPAYASVEDNNSFSPFQHGVASGDPWSTSVILWTRITTTPEDAPGSTLGIPTHVEWQISPDPSFEKIINSGYVTTSAASDSTVRVEATGLEPFSTYYYRFRIASGQYINTYSPIGKAKTAPAEGDLLKEFHIALLSCANWESGYFAAYRDLAQRGDIDLVLHVGDYIYEYQTGEYCGKYGAIRTHFPTHTLVTLQDYRQRYGHYRTDPDLQAAHAACSWALTWDDHEISNDVWKDGSEFITDPVVMKERREAALQAYLEWLPIRAVRFSENGHIYRNLGFGKLCEINLLDLRSYRSSRAEWNNTYDEDRSIMGNEQYEWLKQQLLASQARWNLIGNPVMISPLLLPTLRRQWTQGLHDLIGFPLDGIPYNPDQWDGFPADRIRLLNFLTQNNINNVVFLTGDIHTSWAAEVPIIPGDYKPGHAPAVEFVSPSINSPNIDDMYNLPDNSGIPPLIAQACITANPFIKYCDLEQHGYCVLKVTPEEIQCDWIFVHKKEDPHSSMFIAKTYRTSQGKGIY